MEVSVDKSCELREKLQEQASFWKRKAESIRERPSNSGNQLRAEVQFATLISSTSPPLETQLSSFDLETWGTNILKGL